jgi:hypothetical protein
VTNAAVATEIHQSLDVHRDLTSEVTFHNEIGDCSTQASHFGFSEILHFGIGCNAGRFTNLLRARSSDAVDRGQRDHNVLVDRYVYACYSSHFNYLLKSAAS